jgi:hypothetical protein
MRRLITSSIILAAVVGNYFAGCKSTAPQAQLADFQVIDQQSEQSQGSDLTTGPEDPATIESKLVRSHPKEPTAWFTSKLLLTTQQPSANRVNECRERVDSAVKDAPNLRALDEVATLLISSVNKSPTLYHWCFYQMMSDLDGKLDLETPLMQDKAEIFLTRMRSLFALAKALDMTLPDRIYLRYLRVRYTEISQTVFGRNLENMDPESFRSRSTSESKPAAEFGN